MTSRRYLLPEDIQEHCLHQKKGSSDSSRVARFFRPVVDTKSTEKVVENRTCVSGGDVEHVIRKAFQRVHVSFHSTSPCNIINSNGLNSCKESDMIMARKQFDNRKYWGFYMHEAHKIYVGTYSCIESIYNLIKKCCMKYRCWNYWYSPMLH